MSQVKKFHKMHKHVEESHYRALKKHIHKTERSKVRQFIQQEIYFLTLER